MSGYNWRLHWEPKTRGGYDVYAVLKQPGNLRGLCEKMGHTHWNTDGTHPQTYAVQPGEFDLIPRTAPTETSPSDRIKVALDFAEEHGYPVQPEDREWVQFAAERMAEFGNESKKWQVDNTSLTDAPLVLTTVQVAKICKVAPRTVSKWFDSGRLKGYRIPGTHDRRIPRKHLVSFLTEHGFTVE